MYLFFDTETTGLPAKGQYNNPVHPATPKLVLSRVFIDAKHGSRVDLPKVGRCTKELTTHVCKIPNKWGGFKWPTLQEAHKHFFGVEFDGAHSALADVEACARIFFHMKTKGIIR